MASKATKFRRRQSVGGRWSEKEKNQLWQLRHENLGINWEAFRQQFFPLRSAVALTKAYSDMKLLRDRQSIQGTQPVKTKTRRASQDNKRKLSEELMTEQQPKKQQTSSAESSEETSSFSGVSDTEDSDAGDIPYEEGVPRHVLRNPLRNRPVRNTKSTSGGYTDLKLLILAKQKGKAATSPATNHAADTMSSSHRERAMEPRIMAMKTQSPPVDSTMTGPSAQSSTQGLETASPTGQQYTTTQITEQLHMNAAPDPSSESYESMSRSFQYAAIVFVQYPQVKARAEKAEKESNEKGSYIKEIQSLHKAEVLTLQDRVAVQNKMIQEQRVTIEGLQAQSKMSGKESVEIQRQGDCIKDLMLELEESKKAFQAREQKIEDPNKQTGGQFECDKCSSLVQENTRLREELTSARRLFRMMVTSRIQPGPSTAMETETKQVTPMSLDLSSVN